MTTFKLFAVVTAALFIHDISNDIAEYIIAEPPAKVVDINPNNADCFSVRGELFCRSNMYGDQ